jgi:hypothetical protein
VRDRRRPAARPLGTARAGVAASAATAATAAVSLRFVKRRAALSAELAVHLRGRAAFADGPSFAHEHAADKIRGTYAFCALNHLPTQPPREHAQRAVQATGSAVCGQAHLKAASLLDGCIRVGPVL